MMKNTIKIITTALLLISGAASSTFAQTGVDVSGGNEFNVKDSNKNYPTSLQAIRTYLNGKNKYIYAIIRNNSNYGYLENVRYIVYSVDRTEVMSDTFNGKMYVSHFNAAQGHIETFSLASGQTKSYYTGLISGIARDGYVVYKNYRGQYAGIADGGIKFSYLYEGPFTPARTGDDYFAETFKIPRKINQKIRYIDADTGETVGTDESQVGISGQYFTTKQKTIPGYYVPEVPKHTPGYLSPYHKGYVFYKQSNDYIWLKYTQLDDAGKMRVEFHTDNDYTIAEMAPNTNEDFEYKINGIEYIYTASNQYIPRTNEVVYKYKKVAKIIYTSKSSSFPCGGSKSYTSDPNDATKVLDEAIPVCPGWEPYYNGVKLTQSTIAIQDPGKDTEIEYRRKKMSRVNPQLRVRVTP